MSKKLMLVRTWRLLAVAIVAVLAGAPMHAGAADGALSATDGSGHLLAVDRATGAATLVGTFTTPLTALAIDPATGTLYGGRRAASTVYRVDPLTAAATAVGDASPAATGISALDFDRLAVLYAAVDATGPAGSGADHLAIVDKKTGAMSIVGAFGACGADACTLEGLDAIAFDAAGVLWGARGATPGTGAAGLYQIDRSTGAATFVAAFANADGGAPPTGGIVGLHFDCAGVLNGGTGLAADGATDGGRLVTIEPSGVVHLVGATPAAPGSSLQGLTASQPCGRVVENGLSHVPLVVDGQFTGGVTSSPRAITGEWSDATPLAFISPLQKSQPVYRALSTDARVNSLLYVSTVVDAGTGTADQLYAMFDFLPRARCMYAAGAVIGDITLPLVVQGTATTATVQLRGAAAGRAVAGCGEESHYDVLVDLNGDGISDTTGAALGIAAAVGFGPSTLSLTPHLLVEIGVPLSVPAGFGPAFAAGGAAGIHTAGPAAWAAAFANDYVDPPAAAMVAQLHGDGSIDASSSEVPPAPANLPPTLVLTVDDFSPSAHIVDPDGDALNVQWFVDGTLVATDTVAPPATSADRTLVYAFTGGTHDVSATVSDGHASNASAWVTISVPALSIGNVSITEGDAGSSLAVFTVSLSPVSSRQVTVAYATSDILATAGADYTAQSGPLTFAPGEAAHTISVPIIGDTLNEADETFKVTLSGATHAVLASSIGIGTIVNDDPQPSLAINDVTLNEGTGGTTNFVFTVTLSAVSGQPVTVDYATAGQTATAPGDFTATSGTLTFPLGSTTQTITVPVAADGLVEADETFRVTLSAAVNATIAKNLGIGTIVNDDTLPVLTSRSPLPGSIVPNTTPVTAEFNRSMDPASFTANTFKVQLPPVPATLTTFDELPHQTLDGVSFNGVTYGFTMNGAVSDDASYASTAGPDETGDSTEFLDLYTIEGNARGTLSLTFASPVRFLEFGVALDSDDPVPAGLGVQLFDASNTLVLDTHLDTVPRPGFLFAEAKFTYAGAPVTRALLTFDATTGDCSSFGFFERCVGGRFALDNLRTASVPNPGVPVDLTGTITVAGGVATFNAVPPLPFASTFNVTVVGGAAGVKDVYGNPIAGDITWSFSTVVGGRIVTVKHANPAGDPTVFSFAASYLAPPADPAFRAQTKTTGSSANAAFTKPTGTAAGDVLVTFLTWENRLDLSTPPAGWTQIGSSVASGTVEFQAWYHVVTSADSGVTSWTWNLNGTGTWLTLGSAYSGVSGANPIDGFSTALQGTGSTITAASVPLSAARDLVITFADTNSAGSWTPPSGFVERTEANGQSLADKLFPEATATGPQTATLSASGSTKTMWMIALRRAGVFTLRDGQSLDSGLLNPGTYSLTDLLPANWDLTAASCSDGSPVTAISLQEGETITCSFTNTRRAHIVVANQTSPPADPTLFTYLASYAPTGDPSFRSQTSNSGSSNRAVFTKPSGAATGDVLLVFLTIREKRDVSAPPTGWLQLGPSLVSGSNEFQAWYHVVASDDSAVSSWSWRLTGGGGWVTIGAAYRDVNVAIVADGFSTAALSTGTTVTAPSIPLTVPHDLVVLFNDTNSDGAWTMPSGFSKRAEASGQTIGDRFFENASPTGSQTSTLTKSGSTKTVFMIALRRAVSFVLRDGQSNDSGPLVAGTYSVSELVPPGWALSGGACSNGSPVNAVVIVGGANVTCTFTNTKTP